MISSLTIRYHRIVCNRTTRGGALYDLRGTPSKLVGLFVANGKQCDYVAVRDDERCPLEYHRIAADMIDCPELGEGV